MKKFICMLLTITPILCYSQDYESDFLDNYYMEEVVDDLEGVYHFCKAKMLENEKLMKNTKNTQFYLIYLSKRDAYSEILDYIESK